MKPICYDLYCGLEGWGLGFLAEGFDVIGYDIVDMCQEIGVLRPEGAKLILQDVRSIHGSQLADAACIVASPPCQEPSMRAQPWKRSRALHPTEVQLPEPAWWKIPEKPSPKTRGMTAKELSEWKDWQKKYPCPEPALFIELFNACFRIQREASEAAGRYIPMIVENVRGAQEWVGRSRWNYGSYHLWGDVPALMPIVLNRRMKFPSACGPRLWRDRETPRLNDGENLGRKGKGLWFCDYQEQKKNQEQLGLKQGGDWFGKAEACSMSRRYSSRSIKRKAASAEIAKIPFPLAQHIARCFRPAALEVVSA